MFNSKNFSPKPTALKTHREQRKLEENKSRELYEINFRFSSLFSEIYT